MRRPLPNTKMRFGPQSQNSRVSDPWFFERKKEMQPLRQGTKYCTAVHSLLKLSLLLTPLYLAGIHKGARENGVMEPNCQCVKGMELQELIKTAQSDPYQTPRHLQNKPITHVFTRKTSTQRETKSLLWMGSGGVFKQQKYSKRECFQVLLSLIQTSKANS
jgi:hypothetical protein